ncbi:hypothetical protein BPC006_I1784 [Burkholderia pseudomallei BPC006]|nr:hypothetical protein BPC006_I1784 [Burkholderia pseudomallei BPC006]
MVLKYRMRPLESGAAFFLLRVSLFIAAFAR